MGAWWAGLLNCTDASAADVVDMALVLDECKEDKDEFINDYRLLCDLGQGSFGQVVLAQNEKDEKVAIKIFSKSALSRQRDIKCEGRRMVVHTALQKVQLEIAIMKKLDHCNVVSLIEAIDTEDDPLYLVLEFVPGGEILSWDPKRKRFKHKLREGYARKAISDCICGLQYLHYQKIAHRDLKPQNLLVALDGTIKIADFGVSALLVDTNEGADATSTRCTSDGRLSDPSLKTYIPPPTHMLKDTAGTYHFLAPECLVGHPFDGYSADVWALGITLYAFVFGVLPFGFENQEHHIQAIPYKEENHIEDTSKGIKDLRDSRDSETIGKDDQDVTKLFEAICDVALVFPRGCSVSQTLIDLISDFLNKDPNQRISLSAVQRHAWLGSIPEPSTIDPIRVSEQEISSAVTPPTRLSFGIFRNSKSI